MRRWTLGTLALIAGIACCSTEASAQGWMGFGQQGIEYGVGYEHADDYTMNNSSPHMMPAGYRSSGSRTWRQDIRSTPILQRPYRFGHIYGNNVRRLYLGHP